MAYIEIVTKPDCPHCVKAKNLLSTNGVEYRETLIGHHVTREQVLAKYPDAKQVPIIIVDGERLGGLPELMNMIDRKQL
jgi:glutaredoxin